MPFFIKRDICIDGLAVCYYEKFGNKILIYKDGWDCPIETTRGTNLDEFKPMFVIPADLVSNFVTALRDYGIELPSKDETGELRSTKYHLEDLRILLKLNK